MFQASYGGIVSALGLSAPVGFPTRLGLTGTMGADPVTRLALFGPDPVGFSAPFTRLEPNRADPVAI